MDPMGCVPTNRVPAPDSRTGPSPDAAAQATPGWTDSDQAAWEEFFNDTFPALVTAGLFWGGNQQDAEDAAEVAMIEVRRRWHDISNRHGYARRVVINAVRRMQKSDRRRILRLVEKSEYVDNRHGDHGLEAYEDAQWVSNMLACLPRGQRLVMERLYQGFTHAEIAAHLGKTEANVRQHLVLARRRLKAELLRQHDLERRCAPSRPAPPATAFTRKEVSR